MVINTERFQLKTLTVDDATEEYLSWFSSSKEVGEYIAYAKTNADINKLRQYVKEREDREDVLFLGIFTDFGQHIGNIKYEPINLKDKSATMGILIGDKKWRGKGVATEVIKDSGKYLSYPKCCVKFYEGKNTLSLHYNKYLNDKTFYWQLNRLTSLFNLSFLCYLLKDVARVTYN